MPVDTKELREYISENAPLLGPTIHFSVDGLKAIADELDALRARVAKLELQLQYNIDRRLAMQDELMSLHKKLEQSTSDICTLGPQVAMLETINTELKRELAEAQSRAKRAELFAEHDYMSILPVGDRESGFTEFRVVRCIPNDLGNSIDVFDDYFEFETIVKGCDTAEEAIESALAAIEAAKGERNDSQI